MHEGGHDPEVLKRLCTTSGLALRATKVIAWSLGHAMSTLVVQERHLAVSGRHGDADKVRFPQGPCVPDWPLRRRSREHGPAVLGCLGAD